MIFQQQHNDTLQTIQAMCRQEKEGYKTSDFLYQEQQQQPSAHGPLNLDIDVDCRTKMAAWCYQVVDFCKFNRETVSIAMNLLDRFMMTAAANTAKADRKTYQLCAMTCLYTAVKIHEPEAMDPKLISTLSRGTYQPHEVEETEFMILQALTWRANPPTAMSFVRLFLDLIPGLDSKILETVYDLTKFQTELAVSEYDFLQVPPSVIAYCALFNALESVGMVDTRDIAVSLARTICLNDQEQASEVQMWLYQSIVQEPAAKTIFSAASVRTSTPKKATLVRQASCEVSPRSTAV